MLYPALPPAPPVISITLQPEQVIERKITEKQLFSEQLKIIAEAALENSTNDIASKAQKSELSLEQEEIDFLDGQIDLAEQHYKLLAAIFKAQSLTPEFSNSQATSTTALPTSTAPINTPILVNQSPKVQVIADLPPDLNNNQQSSNNSATTETPGNTEVTTNNIKSVEDAKNDYASVNRDSSNIAQNIKSVGGTFLVGVIINRREVGGLEIRLDGNTILVPLESFAEIANFTVTNVNGKIQLKTPLGVVDIAENNLIKIDGITYISDVLLKEKLATPIEFKASDLALIVNLPWQQDNRESGQPTPELEPDVKPPSSALSSLRQELYLYRNSEDTNLRSSTLLGGRLAGGTWRVRLNNNFENVPDVSEYFFYKRENRFRYQIGRQQIGLHPLLNSMDLTGAQIGLTNLPADSLYQSYSASELLPRRSRPLQTFRGEAPPASFVQLRVSGIVVAQQQVGLNGVYEFVDVRLPVSNSNEIELLIYDRNNISVPTEIRSLRLNTSDLLLPAGGNVQLAGLGLSGNLAQNALFYGFDGDAGEPVGFYQFRQGLSNNLTFEGAIQAIPDTLQAQAGFVWRPASPVILATSLGTSRGELGYTADLDADFGKLEILGNSQLFPSGYYSNNGSGDRYNHSLEVNYRFSNTFSLGFLARSRQTDGDDATNYILPTFAVNPFSGLSLRGRPDTEGQYIFNAFYQISPVSRLSFNSFGDIYTSDFSYNLNRAYQLSLGGEFGGDLSPRYTVAVNCSSLSLGGLNWRLGLAYSDGDVGPVVGASMQVLPGLLARVDYQGIPSRSKNIIGGFGDDRLTISLVSDLSFAGGKLTPAKSYGLGRERGGIAGRIVVEGENKDFNLAGAAIRVVDSRNKTVGGSQTDSFGNFFVGNLPEGVYVVELDPNKLPVELSTVKTSIVAEVASSAVTRLNFPVREEYGMAGKITDTAGQAVAKVKVELIGSDGKPVTSGMTDEFGFYRFDNVPVGKYTIQVPSQDATAPSDNLAKRVVQIKNEFVFDQNLQLPISAAAKKK
ncbi:Cna B-type [Fischerella thermalis WC114]|uniref:carboxypeptidase regulatory-like domain-containing protein n=1 Tax=Fischerella thermalis TaxID=372787 RepID=UPI000C7F997B|nr:carboxypeptidase regulatory-like domain-containing protein [Fischerella thermalis]PLZ12642.1 Cna B-type [Fischerella thermalis WC114]PLZ22342.1 Cna B-type [Fischerella thermalis WC157]PLZ63644.1 Cna B-type [Fischerella thermalis WC249]